MDKAKLKWFFIIQKMQNHIYKGTYQEFFIIYILNNKEVYSIQNVSACIIMFIFIFGSLQVCYVFVERYFMLRMRLNGLLPLNFSRNKLPLQLNYFTMGYSKLVLHVGLFFASFFVGGNIFQILNSNIPFFLIIMRVLTLLIYEKFCGFF